MSWLLIPLDDRPCCFHFPQQLAPVRVPPREWLGRFQQPGQCELLLDWLEEHAAAAEGLVLSLDMLAWGGLVASRQPQHSLSQARARVQRAAALPGPKLAFQTILRNAPTQTTAQEMAWAEALVRLSESLGEDAAVRGQIPAEMLSRYLETRRRNAELYRFSGQLHWDYLLYALDDSRTRGWNVEELRQLGPVPSLPGTDETALLLLCRAVCPGRELQVVWSSAHVPDFLGSYEDRACGPLLQAHLQAAAAREAPAGDQLWLYARPGQQGQPEARDQEPAAVDEAWLDRLEAALDQGHRIVLVDLSFANGGDLSLGQALLQRRLWPRLHGYAAWNTLGNRVGTAIANLLLPLSPAQQREFLLQRLADDLLYQADFRWRGARLLGHPGLTLTPAEESRMERELFPALLEALQPYAEQLQTRPDWALRLPWARLFELEIVVQSAAG